MLPSKVKQFDPKVSLVYPQKVGIVTVNAIYSIIATSVCIQRSVLCPTIHNMGESTCRTFDALTQSAAKDFTCMSP